MAEQIRHNVVDNTESTSGMLVDTAANHTTTDVAGNGNNSQTDSPTASTEKSNQLESTKAQNERATDANANSSTSATESETKAGQAAAEPSAGDVAASIPKVSATANAAGEKQDGRPAEQMANGTSNAASPVVTATDDGQHGDVSADVSVASDTDSTNKDGKKHVRAESVKKPTTFSKVSATKNFLAKTVTAAPSAVKIGERASPLSATPGLMSKPRLVAKSASSLQTMQKPRQGSETTGTSETGTVWNKNRPAPAPVQKQFTDEELKQQYGIHLATRLQSDENGKESKWADIDDDEDDWTPETVVWMDGTKSSLTPAESTPTATIKDEQAAVPEPPPKPAEPVRPDLSGLKKQTEPVKPTESVKPTEPVRPDLSALKKPTEKKPIEKQPPEPTGPPKTILKPGAAAQAKQNGLNSPLPGQDKPSLKAKSPAPMPAKSPWAPLPPVERVSPINAVPQFQKPQQTVAPTFATQDARAYDSMQPPPPAREIAAYTFDRSWREGEGERRELFNSANGRYEPAPEARRPSNRAESFARKPAVLQRPSQSGPAGPSAAFQTRSGSNTDGPPSWGRRRGSSISQGSLPPGRRMSINRGPEPMPPPERRMSSAIVNDVRAPDVRAPTTNTSPTEVKPDGTPDMFLQQNAWAQQMPPPPPPGEPAQEVEDPVKAQERVMREKREAARKRRQEEEEREEAAKQERLRARLAALGGAGKSRKEREAEAAAVAVATPTAEKPVEPTSLPDKVEQVPAVVPEEQKPKEVEIAAEKAPALEAQAQIPATHAAPSQPISLPDKVDAPAPINKMPQDADLPAHAAPPADQTYKQPASRGQLSPRVTSRMPYQQGGPSPYRTPGSGFPSPGERKPQSFDRSPMPNNNAFSPWPSSGTSNNVWGTSGIGNGTFENSSSFAPMSMSQHITSLPPPPGMGRPTTSSRISPQGFAQDARSPSLQQTQTAEQQRTFQPSSMEPRADHFMGPPRHSGVSPSPGMGRQQHVPGPIAPPSRAQPHQPQRSDVSAWNNAAARLPSQYMSDAKSAEESKKKDVPVEAKPPRTVIETFRATKGFKIGAAPKYEKAEKIIHDTSGSRQVDEFDRTPSVPQAQSSVPPSTVSPLNNESWKPADESIVRMPGSKNIPPHLRARAAMPTQPPIGPPSAKQQLPLAPQVTANQALSPLDRSPPPPETQSHPVYSGDSGHPNVKLPPPPPVVRLPPSQLSTSQMSSSAPVMMPPRPAQRYGGVPGQQRPLVQSEAWQQRFNGLFNRTPISTETPPSPPKTPPKMQGLALAVASSSKALMDDAQVDVGATVSLPQSQQQQTKKNKSPEGFTIDDSSDVTSKPTIEQTFTEELSFGSKPQVHIPRHATYESTTLFDPRNTSNAEPKQFPSWEVQPVREFSLFKYPHGFLVKLPGWKGNSLIKYSNNNNGRKAYHQDRKTSGNKFGNKGKPYQAGPSKENAQQSGQQAESGPQTAGATRNSSYQQPKELAGANTAPIQDKIAPFAGNANAGGNGKKRAWAKGPRAQNAPVKST